MNSCCELANKMGDMATEVTPTSDPRIDPPTQLENLRSLSELGKFTLRRMLYKGVKRNGSKWGGLVT